MKYIFILKKLEGVKRKFSCVASLLARLPVRNGSREEVVHVSAGSLGRFLRFFNIPCLSELNGNDKMVRCYPENYIIILRCYDQIGAQLLHAR